MATPNFGPCGKEVQSLKPSISISRMRIQLLSLVFLALLLVGPVAAHYDDCYEQFAYMLSGNKCEDGYHPTVDPDTIEPESTFTCCRFKKVCIEIVVSFTAGVTQECPNGYYENWTVFPLMQCCENYHEGM
uniref:SVWC domain-containing protein n=1 Tax=Steinernema glaseri TaxID=37863 RepID=A0A1I7ZK89_9BILA